MSDPWWNPRPSNYAGRFRLAAIACVAGFLLIVLGFGAGSEVVQTLGVSGGLGLLIGGVAVALSTARSRARAAEARKG